MTEIPLKSTPVVICGALGRMGCEVVKAVHDSKDCDLIAAIDISPEKEGLDVGEELGIGEIGIALSSDFEGTLCSASQINTQKDNPRKVVLVDFTHPSSVYEHTRAAIAYGISPVIGTTGLSYKQILELKDFSIKASVGGAVIPNFSVGMVLLQQAAAAAAAFYDHAELTELHHNLKADSPSGTCIKTAEMMEELGKKFNYSSIDQQELIDGCRGAARQSGLRMHSIRLPGLVAHQEVMFGAPGETYTIRHDTIDRKAYMPGVILTINKVVKLNSLIYGLEKVIS